MSFPAPLPNLQPPYTSYTEEDKHNIILNMGLDPEEYYFDPLTSTAFRHKPKVENSEPAANTDNVTAELKRNDEAVTRAQAMGAALKVSTLPAITGALGAARGLTIGAPFGPWGEVGGALIGATVGGLGGSYLQNKTGLISPETQTTLARGREQFPVETAATELVPNLMFNKAKALSNIGTLGKAAIGAMRGQVLAPEVRAGVLNSLANVGVNSAMEAGQQLYVDKKIDPSRLATIGLGGGLLFGEPTKLGEAFGFHPVNPNAYPKAQEGSKTTIRGYLPEETPSTIEAFQERVNPTQPRTENGPGAEPIILPNNLEEQRVIDANIANAKMASAKRSADFAKAKQELATREEEIRSLEIQKQIDDIQSMRLAKLRADNEVAAQQLKELQARAEETSIGQPAQAPSIEKPSIDLLQAKKKLETGMGPKFSSEPESIQDISTANKAITKQQEETLLKRRGQNLQIEPDLQVGGERKLGEIIPAERKIRISEKTAVPTTIEHEGIHGFLYDLKNSPAPRDQKLYRKAIQAGEDIRRDEANLGPNDKATIADMEAQGYSRKDIAEELFTRKASVEDYKRLINRPVASKGTFGEFWRDVGAHFKYKLGSADAKDVIRHLNSRYNFDAAYGTRPDVMPAAPEARTTSDVKHQTQPEDVNKPLPAIASHPAIKDVIEAKGEGFVGLPAKWNKSLTQQAYDVGKEVKTPEDVAYLKEMDRKMVRDILDRLQSGDDNKIREAVAESSKAQFFREAWEYATGTGSGGEMRATGKYSSKPEDQPPLTIRERIEQNRIKDEKIDSELKTFLPSDKWFLSRKISGMSDPVKVTITPKSYKPINKDPILKAEKEISINKLKEAGYTVAENESDIIVHGQTKDGVKFSSKPEDSGEATPERYGFVKLMEGAIDKVAQVGGQLGKDVAEGATKFFALKSRFEGQYRNTPYYDINDMKLSDQELNNIRDFRRANFRGNTEDAPELTPKEQAGNKILTDAWLALRDEQNKRGLQVETSEGDLRAGKRNEHYISDMLSDEALQLFTKKAGSIEAKNAERAWVDYVVKESKGKLAKEEVAKNIEAYINALSGSKLHAIEYNALRKAQGYGVPEEIRELNLRKIILKYGRRASKDLAYWSELQSQPRIAAALSLPKRQGGVSKMEGVESIANNPHVQNLMKFIFDDFSYISNPRINAIARTASNLLLGGATGIRNTVQLPSLIAPYLETTADVSATLKAFSNLGEARRKSLEYGARSGTMDLDRWYTLENPDKVTQFFNRVAEAARKYQGRDLLEQTDRILTFAVGQELAKNKVLEALNGREASLKWLEKFGTLEKVTPDNLENIDINQIAKNFTDRVQGTYDARGLAAGVFDSPFAPFMALSRWSIEKSNVLWKDVIEPARAGNLKPLIVYTLGSFLTGAAIKELNEIMSGKKDYAPSLKEAHTEDKKQYEVAAVANLMQMGSYMGLVGDLIKASSDLFIQKDLPRSPLTFPAVTFAEDFVYTIADFRNAIDKGADPVQAFLHFGWETMRQSTQNLRLLDSRVLNPNDTEKANKYRDLRVFKKLEGESLPFASGTYRRERISELTPEKQFRKEEDLGKAANMLPKLIEKAIKDSNNDPYKLKRELDSLKINSYQTMPAPENDPLAFAKFIQFLSETQGASKASEVMADYFTKREVNKAKARMVP